MLKKGCFAIVFLSLMLTRAHSADNMKAFPPPAEGMNRWVLQVPPRIDEASHRVQLIVGKTVEVDSRNRYFFSGSIERETLQGWGFSKYLVRKLGPMAGTLMAVDPDAPKVSRFVEIAGEPYLVRYNSRLPVVIYAPAGAEVRYRIWSAGEALPMPRG